MTPLSLLFIFTVCFTITTVNTLGTASTTAITTNTSTICGIVAGKPHQYIQCYQNGKLVPISLPNVSFQSISGGRSFFCGLRSNGLSLHCWDTTTPKSFLKPKRLYHSEKVRLSDVAVGDDHVCARELHSGVVKCWRGYGGVEFPSPDESFRFRSVTCGYGFCCGILKVSYRVFCWGVNGEKGVENLIQKQFENVSMSTLVSGVSHVCGLTVNGVLVCKGKNNNKNKNNDSGKLNVPLNSGSIFSGLALGENFTCAIRIKNGFVQCWGDDFDSDDFDSDDDVNNDVMKGVSFESIVAGLDFVCGLTTRNLSLICWGNPNWYSKTHLISDVYVPLGMILPSPCVVSDSCSSCGVYPNSDFLCHGFGTICYQCRREFPFAVKLPPPISSPMNRTSIDDEGNGEKGLRGWKLMMFLIIGSVGAFAGLCTILYFLMIGARKLVKAKIDNSVQPTSSESDDAYVDIAPMHNNVTTTTLRSFSSKRHSSSRLRSGSSSKQLDRTEIFAFWELVSASDNFSVENKIGAGSFGCVYKGRLLDGREVAIKRGDTTCTKKKKFQEKETSFDSEITLLSRLHHKHLVRLIGFCEENDERLLVYEYMSNGSLHDHLHDKNNVEKNSSIMNSWKMRIKVALDAARGIEYIHNYAVPPIIHRDIKSSNILLDSKWNARVSDFGLSLIWQETELELMSDTKAVGTVGYIDPEYYVSNVLTTKSDVYGLGVVMLELLTGKRAVFKTEDGSSPIGVVEYAGPKIGSGEVWNLLDDRVGMPEVNEVESVEIMAYTAMHCVNLEGRERPNMVDIVANLERALSFLEGSPGSFSMSSFSATLT